MKIAQQRGAINTIYKILFNKYCLIGYIKTILLANLSAKFS